MTVNRIYYHLMWMLEQYCTSDFESPVLYGKLKTNSNASAFAVHDLENEGFCVIDDGSWPHSKFLEFHWSDTGIKVMEEL